MVVDETLDTHLGFEYFDLKEDSGRASVPLTNKVRQPYGIVHGGAFAALAESLASILTAAAVWDDGNIAVGMSNATSFMRPATEGTLHAQATRRHRGRTTWVWDVDHTDGEGRLVAVSRVTIAVRARDR